ncbi:MAG TPA: ThiF family adenylyltransferase [Pyrinomonadaceae bacterium]|nr:ThiF family adenylyltransferase [Pyrinomonadaceae bacterium]
MNQQSANENIKTLAATLGLTHETAAELLHRTAAITFCPENRGAAQFADYLSKLLTCTITDVVINASTDTPPAVEVVIADAVPKSDGSTLWVTLSEDKITIAGAGAAESEDGTPPAIFSLLAACYAAGRVLREVIGDALPFPCSDPLVLNINDLFGEAFNPSDPFDVDVTYMAGAGAIANGFILGMSLLNPSGELHIADPDYVSAGNLNRCIWFTEDCVGMNKAERLVELAQPSFPHLRLSAHDCRLQHVPAAGTCPVWLQRLVVAVDSRKARRGLQGEIPGEVYDASTTDIREVVFHFNQQPLRNLACLSCVYAHVQDEFAHEQHVAEILGVTLEDLKDCYVSQAAAMKIAGRYEQYEPDQLEGAAYDTLFKELCGEGQLKESEDRVVLAPFSFVSIMAGVYLAIEFARRLRACNPVEPFNYWKISPWFNPLVELRKSRERKTGCEFCGNPIIMEVASDIWGHN